jgi:hypothetical protein
VINTVLSLQLASGKWDCEEMRIRDIIQIIILTLNP